MKRILIILVLLLNISTSFAQEVDNSSESNIENISKTWVKYSDEFILSNKNVLDSYIMLHHCNDGIDYFNDEIARENFRKELKKNLIKNKDQQPHIYKLLSPMILKDYDFENEEIILDEESIFEDVSEIVLPYSRFVNSCTEKRNNSFIDKTYTVLLNGKINIKNIPMSIEEAKKHIKKMKKIKNTDTRAFFMVLTVDITGILKDLSSNTIFKGNVLDVGYYLDVEGKERFGEYNFLSKEEQKEKNLLEDLKFDIK